MTVNQYDTPSKEPPTAPSSPRDPVTPKCPPRRLGEESFSHELVAIDDGWFRDFRLHAGDEFEDVNPGVLNAFSGAKVETMLVIGRPVRIRGRESDPDDSSSSLPVHHQLDEEILFNLFNICDQLEEVGDMNLLRDLCVQAERQRLLEPLNNDLRMDPLVTDELEGPMNRYPVMLTMTLEPNAECFRREFVSGGNLFLELVARDSGSFSFFESYLLPLHPGRSFRAAVMSMESDDYTVQILLELVSNPSFLQEILRGPSLEPTTSLGYTCLWEQHQNRSVVEGVAVVDDAFDENLRKALACYVDAYAWWQENNKAAAEYHQLLVSASSGVVRCLVDPDMYPYIKGVSQLEKPYDEASKFLFPEKKFGRDFWGRPYDEASNKYHRLPTCFTITAEGLCIIENYINNLTPLDTPVVGALYNCLACLFQAALPHIEAVFGYSLKARPQQDLENASKQCLPSSFDCVSLRGQKLQVITKIVDYDLQQEQSHVDTWHFEGTSRDEIVLTCMYVLDRDECLEGGELEFKREFLPEEREFILSAGGQRRPRALDEILSNGFVPLGRKDVVTNRLLVIPNSHSTRMSEMVNMREVNAGKCRIIFFFLVNPFRRIESTSEVAPQQEHSGGTIAHQEALKHRIEFAELQKQLSAR